MYSTNKNICFPILLILLLTFLYVAVILKNFQSTTIEKSEDMPEPITTELDIEVDNAIQTRELHGNCTCHKMKNPQKLNLQEYLVKRKLRIKQYCNRHKHDVQLKEVNTDSKWNEDLWFDYKYGFLYCQISKVGSSTWVDVMLQLKNVNHSKLLRQMKKRKVDPSEWRPIMRQKWFHIENDSSIQEANEKLLSFVFVRDPISRIISSYYDKMFRDWSEPQFDLTWMRNEILANYRNVDPDEIFDSPSPTEFVQYILDSAEKYGPHNLDNHIKPMWAACPFCAIEFDIIGKLESRDKEATLISEKLQFPVRIMNDKIIGAF